MTHEGTRRRFLTAVGSTGLAAMAGCTFGYSGGGPRSAPGETTPERVPAQELTDHPWTGTRSTIELGDGEETEITVQPCRHAVLTEEAQGGPMVLPEVWAWSADGNDPSVPGPLYRLEEGSEIRVTLQNDNHVRPHTFHVHGFRKSWEDDGVPTTTGVQVDPNDSHTYELQANAPGTHLYHCHYQTHNHLDMGMYGVMRVDPEGYEPADVERYLTVREWDDRLHRQMAGGRAEFSHDNRRPNVFTIDGRAAPTTFHPEYGSPTIVTEGDTVRLHLVNAGYEAHSIHTHNHRFTVVEKDGGIIPEAARHEEDVLSIAPAERKTIEFEADADPGIYAVHCHRVNHATNGERYPGGMLTALVYESVTDTDQFETVMSNAGYEG